MKGNWFEFWKQQIETKEYCECCRDDAIGNDTRYVFVYEMSGIGGDCSPAIGQWIWSNDKRQLLSFLVEGVMRVVLANSVDEQIENTLNFPFEEYARRLLDKCRDKYLKHAYLRAISIANEIYELIDSDGDIIDDKIEQIVKKIERFSCKTDTWLELSFCRNKSSALRLVHSHECIDNYKKLTLNEIFSKDFLC